MSAPRVAVPVGAKTPRVGTNPRRHSQPHPALPIDDQLPVGTPEPAAAATPFRWGDAQLHLGDSLELAASWPAPTVIVSDGPYGLGSYPGDPTSSADLPDWYEPHVRLWASKALPETTLWFWNSEIGWARVHPVLERHGWQYRACHVWDKGTAHIAGNANTKTLRQFPVVTEVCVQYVRRVEVEGPSGPMSLKAWLRGEWVRAGLPLYAANAACGVRNAATRKYLTQCDLWYFPPPDAFERLAAHANRHGRPEGRPYYSLDGDQPLTGDAWSRMRAKFHCPVGITNVWHNPAVRGAERVKNVFKCVHMNQKPLALLKAIILASSDPGDVVWEPFGGLCSAALAAVDAGRRAWSAEILPEYHRIACERIVEHANA